MNVWERVGLAIILAIAVAELTVCNHSAFRTDPVLEPWPCQELLLVVVLLGYLLCGYMIGRRLFRWSHH